MNPARLMKTLINNAMDQVCEIIEISETIALLNFSCNNRGVDNDINDSSNISSYMSCNFQKGSVKFVVVSEIVISV